VAYATQTDIENIFGVANVARWSQLDNSISPVTADTSRIALAITNATANIEDRFRGTAYAVPFNPVPTKVTEWAAKMAGVWLYSSRGVNSKTATDEADQRILYHQRVTMEEMDLYAGGSRKFALTSPLAGRGGTAPWIVAGVPQ
jgi:phage gp36-like protein